MFFLLTLNQRLHMNRLTIKKYLIVKRKKSRLKYRPQIRGIVIKLRISTPRKPNSARRPVVKAVLSNKKHTLAHIPGGAHNIRKHSELLFNGVGARDLPGVNMTCIKGVYDFAGSLIKTKRRSIYGTKKSIFLKKKLRRKYRNM
jgi:small subunit ribosomal protein S12